MLVVAAAVAVVVTVVAAAAAVVVAAVVVAVVLAAARMGSRKCQGVPLGLPLGLVPLPVQVSRLVLIAYYPSTSPLY